MASPREERDETAAGDELAAVPRGLSASRWERWRAKHRPPYFRRENHRGSACGVCGEPLGVVSRMCVACHRRQLEAAR